MGQTGSTRAMMTRAVLYTVLFLPLFFTGFTFFPWNYGKTAFFQIIMELTLAALVYGAYKTNRLYRVNRTYSLLDIVVFVFLIILTLAAVFGADFNNSFFGNQSRADGIFTWWHFFVFYLLLRGFMEDKNDRRRFVSVATLAAAIASLTIFLPAGFLPPSMSSPMEGGIIGNRAFLAFYLLPAIGLSAFLYFGARELWKKVFWAAVSGIMLWALIITTNRGSFLGLGVGILVTFIFIFADYLKNKLITKGRKVLFGAVAVALLLLVIGFFYFLRTTDLKYDFPQVYKLSDITVSSGTGATRLMAWKIALRAIQDRPVLGWGTENFSIAFDKYFPSEMMKYGFTETFWDKPHNWFLEMGVSAGILGLLAFLSVYFAAVYCLFKSDGWKGEKPVVRAVFIGLLAGYFAQGLFLFETFNSLILFFLILAIISSGATPRTLPEKEEGISMKWGAMLFLILLAFSLYRFHYIPLKSSYHMRQADLSKTPEVWAREAQMAIAVPQPYFIDENAVFLAEQFVDRDRAGWNMGGAESVSSALKIMDILDSEAKNHPENLAYPLWSGQVYLVLGEKYNASYYAEAEKRLLAAHLISPTKQEILFLLGRLYLLKQDFPRALEVQKEAVALAPDVGGSHWFYGLALVASGDRAGGLKEIEKAQELRYTLKGDNLLYVLDLYALEKNYPKLIEEYTGLINQEPENNAWYVKLATVYAVSGDKAAAMKTVRDVVNMFPFMKAEADKFIKEYKLDK